MVQDSCACPTIKVGFSHNPPQISQMKVIESPKLKHERRRIKYLSAVAEMADISITSFFYP